MRGPPAIAMKIYLRCLVPDGEVLAYMGTLNPDNTIEDLKYLFSGVVTTFFDPAADRLKCKGRILRDGFLQNYGMDKEDDYEVSIIKARTPQPMANIMRYPSNYNGDNTCSFHLS